MAVNASTTRAAVSVRARSLSPAVALGLVVGAGFLLRLAVLWWRETPALFPDEYIYTEIARSLSSHGLPLIRGGSAHFPSLLAPLVAAPVWLIHDTLVAYRVLQILQALSMSLVAVPVFLLGRHLRLRPGLALGAAAVAVVVPDFLYSGYTTAEPYAYPLAVAAVAAGVVALEAPTRRRHVLFLTLAALAALARIQFVVVPIAFAAAAVGVGLRERRLRHVLREQRLPFALLAAGAAAAAVVGLGYYSELFKSVPGVAALSRTTGENMLVLAYAAGWTIVPGALLGLALGILRPLDRRELAFAALTVAFGAGVLAQAALYAPSIHERYVFYVIPLLALAFATYAQRGWPYRLYHALAAAAVLTAAMLVPLTNLSFRGEVNAPVLIAVHWLRLHIVSFGSTAMLVLWIAGAGTAVLVACLRRPRLATAFALAFAIALCLATWGLATDYDRHNNHGVREQTLPANRSWVDAFHLGRVTLVQSFAGQRMDALNQLFWNRSVDRVTLLPGSIPIDAFDNSRLTIAGDGTLMLGKRALRGPLLLNIWGSTLQLHGARPLAASVGYSLWAPTGPARLSLYWGGRYSDRWTLPDTRIDVWDAKGSALVTTVQLPYAADATTLRVTLPQNRVVRYRMVPGRAYRIALPVCAAGNWHALLRFSTSGYIGPRLLSAKTSTPRLVPGADCS